MEIRTLMREYLRALGARGFSRHTVKGAKSSLHIFASYLEREKITGIGELSREVLEDYQQEIAFAVTRSGRSLGVRTQERRLSIVMGFTRYLKERDYLIHDPGASIKLPKKPRTLPRAILSEPEVRRLIAAPDPRTRHGLRNRLILEVLYDTGARRAEMASMMVADLDLDGGYVRVCGKGHKDRVVPVSARVCRLAREYLLMVRPAFLRGADPGYLILNHWGGKISPDRIAEVVERASTQARLKTRVTTHTLRHCCATHMLRAGAPIRHIQEMLGHESLESTQVYTRVTINDLKEIHAKYHPSATMADIPR